MKYSPLTWLMLLVACDKPQAIPDPTPPPLGRIDAQAWGADIIIQEYQATYTVWADLAVEYDTAEVIFDARVKEGYENSSLYYYESTGIITQLEIGPKPERDIAGWPAYTIESTAYIEEYEITLHINGVMYFERYDPEYPVVVYDFDGLIDLTLFGESVTVEDEVYYQDDDDFVGEIGIWSRNWVVEAPAGAEPSPTPHP